MPGTFKVSPGYWGYPQIIQNKASTDQVLFLRRALGAHTTTDIFYQKKLPADPDVVGLSIDFVRVDFGCLYETAVAYVDWLNSVYDETLLELGIAGYDY